MKNMNDPEICASCPYLYDGYYDPVRNEYIDAWECRRPEGPCGRTATDGEIYEEED